MSPGAPCRLPTIPLSHASRAQTKCLVRGSSDCAKSWAGVMCRESGGGQLGLDSDFDYWSPTQVKSIMALGSTGNAVEWKADGADDLDPPNWRVAQVSAGFNHTAAVIEMAAGSD